MSADFSRPGAILFDAGNTLIFLNRERVFGIFEEVGVQRDEPRYAEAEFHAREQLARRIEEGSTGTEAHVWREYFGTLFTRSGVPGAALEQVGKRLREEHQKEHLWTHVEEGTKESLLELAEEGYRLGVISNADGRVEGVLRAVGLRDLVEFVVDSAVVGVEKPDPEIFLEGARRIGFPPESCLYVGDLYPVDVVGARGVGMSAVLLDPSGRLDHPVDRIPAVRDLPDYLRRRVGEFPATG